MHLPETVLFNRPKKYKVIQVLGSGACGQTILLKDEEIDCKFVAKKYAPIISRETAPGAYFSLLQRFQDEARILFRLSHPNVVRVYNYFNYSEVGTAYILMEYVQGTDIIEFLAHNPLDAEAVFAKTIDGFLHLEERGVLHRDIRPFNILVDDRKEPRIIDFGFGKEIDETIDTEKSISLNWWCDVPPEFADGIYDQQTEVYFVGKLFEEAIVSGNLADFKFRLVVRGMTHPDRAHRIANFAEAQRLIARGQFPSLGFNSHEKEVYREFADELVSSISSVDSSVTYNQDPVDIISKLDAAYRDTMLEEVVPNTSKVIQVFVRGAYRYFPKKPIKVDSLKAFLDLLRSFSAEKQAVVVRNMTSRLDTIDRFGSDLDDDIPF